MTDWTEDEGALLDQIARFAAEVLAPRAAWLDETATFATCHLPAMAALGLMGLNLPEADGGLGLAIMRERAHGVGGGFDIHSTHGSGTTVEALLPYEPAPNAKHAGQPAG